MFQSGPNLVTCGNLRSEYSTQFDNSETLAADCQTSARKPVTTSDFFRRCKTASTSTHPLCQRKTGCSIKLLPNVTMDPLLKRRRTMAFTAAVTVITVSGTLIGATLKSRQQIRGHEAIIPLLVLSLLFQKSLLLLHLP